ncbi:MAG: YitT family protein [Halanaerobiales bacterium]|nr:YitT family protein [Halanaerobiales bacterium]
MKNKVILDYLGITFGSALTALALTVFLIPNRIAAGGVSGLATVVYYLTNFPVGIMMLIFNIPIFFLGVRVLGASFGARTIYGMIVLSLFTDLLQPLVAPLTNDLLLATIYGGALAGLGLGIVFNSRGTTGGTDMVARLINHYTSFSIGQGLLLADGFVVLLAGVFFNAEVALYAAITILISSKTIDLVQEGFDFAKAVLIISSESERVKAEVINVLDRGLTVLKGYGGYTGDDKNVLLCIISRSEVVKLKRLVYQVDPDAFMIITNVHEALGEGFKEIE